MKYMDLRRTRYTLDYMNSLLKMTNLLTRMCSEDMICIHQYPQLLALCYMYYSHKTYTDLNPESSCTSQVCNLNTNYRKVLCILYYKNNWILHKSHLATENWHYNSSM